MKRSALALGLVCLALIFGLAGCSVLQLSQLSGKTTAATSNEVDMGISSFVQQRVTIQAGQSVKFVDPPGSGGFHTICIGANLTCHAVPGAPAALSGPTPLIMQNGDRPVNVTFTTPGVYQVICTIHPGMVMTIDVK